MCRKPLDIRERGGGRTGAGRRSTGPSGISSLASSSKASLRSDVATLLPNHAPTGRVYLQSIDSAAQNRLEARDVPALEPGVFEFRDTRDLMSAARAERLTCGMGAKRESRLGRNPQGELLPT